MSEQPEVPKSPPRSVNLVGHDSRLSNLDLAPVADNQRRWGAYSLFAWWMTILHNLGMYAFIFSLFFLGLSIVQVFAAMLIATIFVHGGITLTGRIGQKLAVPFPVVARISFGVFGANLPALIRGIFAVFWYGVQTYLASLAVYALILRFAPGAASLTNSEFLGLSTLGWISFLIMWGLQLLVVHRGMEVIRRFQNWSGPAVYLVLFALLIWIVGKSGWSLNFNVSSKSIGGGEATLQFASVVFLIVAYFGTYLLNFSDFSRFSPSERSMRRGAIWGLIPNWFVLAVTIVLITSASKEIYGRPISDITELITLTDSDAIILFGSIVLLVATIGVNVVGNFVSASYDLTNVAPRWFTFTKAGSVAAVASIVITPWNLYSNPVVIDYFISGLGSALGPVFGVMVVDYYSIRRQYVDIDALFKVGDGPYWYSRGVNPRAIIALLAGVLFGATLVFVPALHDYSAFSWLVGAVISGGVYRTINRGRVGATAL